MTELRTRLFEHPNPTPCIARVPLADLPTPVEHTPIVLADSTEIDNLWVKRDDKTSALYGGNKVRKLEYLIADVKQRGVDRVVTFGGIGTNHGVATALYCQQNGIQCTVLLFDQPLTPVVSNNLKIMASTDATLLYRGSLLNTALQYYWRKCTGAQNAYYLDAGGSNTVGCLGFVNAAFELRDQIHQGQQREPDYIFCPVGSSGTLAGLAVGCQLAGLNCRVVGIRVAPSHLGPIPICTSATATRLAQKTYALLRKRAPSIAAIDVPTIELNDAFYGTGYGASTAEAEAAIACLATVNITLESTYTAKAAAAALAFCRQHPEKRVLYWHTFNSADTAALIDPARLNAIPQSLRARLTKASTA